jgi:probable rRNA maturation factor
MIHVHVTSTVRSRVNTAGLRRAATAALAGRVRAADVSIQVVGERLMRALNRDALGHDYVTDVLSFDHGDSPEGQVIELVVCAPFAARQAKARGIPAGQELARYVVHGCLHCVGHDDATPAGHKAMWAEQERVLKQLFGKAYREG